MAQELERKLEEAEYCIASIERILDYLPYLISEKPDVANSVAHLVNDRVQAYLAC